MHLLILTIIIYLFPIYAGLINLRHKSTKIRNGILVYCGVVTSIAWQVGTDFIRYIALINNKTSYEVTLVEPLTEFLYFVSNRIGEPRLFWLFLAIITYGSIFLLIQNFEESEKDFTIIIFFEFFGIIGIALRQISSIAVSLLAIQSYYTREYRKSGIYFVIAWSIHKTAILTLVVPILGWILKKLNKYQLALLPTTLMIVITKFQDTIHTILEPFPFLVKHWDAIIIYEAGITYNDVSIIISAGFGLIYILTSEKMQNILSPSSYEHYLVSILGYGLLFGFAAADAIHIARLMVIFSATGLHTYIHFFRTKNIPGIITTIMAYLFSTVIMVTYEYVPYNFSKDIYWISEDSLEFKNGHYGNRDDFCNTGDNRIVHYDVCVDNYQYLGTEYTNNNHQFVESFIIPILVSITLGIMISIVFYDIWKKIQPRCSLITDIN